MALVADVQIGAQVVVDGEISNGNDAALGEVRRWLPDRGLHHVSMLQKLIPHTFHQMLCVC